MHDLQWCPDCCQINFVRSRHGCSDESCLLVEVSAHLVSAQYICWLLVWIGLDALQAQVALCPADLLDYAAHCQHSSFWGRGSERAIEPERHRV